MLNSEKITTPQRSTAESINDPNAMADSSKPTNQLSEQKNGYSNRLPPQTFKTDYKHFGVVSINMPFRTAYVTIGLTLITLIGLCSLLLSSFSEKITVSGFINSNKGIVSIYPKHAGFIRESHVHLNQQLKKNTPLFLIDTTTERFNQNELPDEIRLITAQQHRIKNTIKQKKQYFHQLDLLWKKKYLTLNDLQEKQAELNALETQLHLLNMSRIHYQKANQTLIRSPINGTVLSVNYHAGQYVDSTKPLIKILPKATSWVVELLIPVSKISFIKPNMPVIIRFDAWPHQRFGATQGIIQQIEKSLLTDEEEDKPFKMKEPYYKVLVTLNSTQLVLRQGMTLNAVLIGPKKKLWQWIGEPLHNELIELKR